MSRPTMMARANFKKYTEITNPLVSCAQPWYLAKPPKRSERETRLAPARSAANPQDAPGLMCDVPSAVAVILCSSDIPLLKVDSV